MAAKRLGSALTNITGVAGQVLKVKGDESGFEFATPATIPSYTVTNKTTDRVINADDVTLDEVADVLSTLIDDLAATGAPGGVQQVYTSGTYSHTGSNTPTTYTITHNLGSEPDCVMCQFYDTNNKWVNIETFVTNGGNYYGWRQIGNDNSDSNVVKFEVYRLVYAASANIRFICAKIGSVAAITPFQWSTSEQVWPFEKDQNGNTLYAREYNFANGPNNGAVLIAHGIPSFSASKIKRCAIRLASGTSYMPFPNGYWSALNNYDMTLGSDSTNINLTSTRNFSSYSGTVELIYSK